MSWNILNPNGSDSNNFYDFSLGEITSTSKQDTEAYKIVDVGEVKGIDKSPSRKQEIEMES